MCSPSPGARDQHASTRRKEQQQRGRPTLYLFYYNKRTLASSNRPRGKRGLPTFPRATPRRPPPPQPIQRLSKLPPRPRGWIPEVKSGDPVASLGGGGDPRKSCPLKPREPRGAGTPGGLGSVGAGPGRRGYATIGRGPRTGGWASRAGPTPLAMSSARCTPNLSIYSTGIEAVGAALAPAKHGWDFLFRPLFVSLWDLQRCHRFQGVPRERR